MYFGDNANAEKLFEEVIRLEPDWATALANLAHVKLALGKEDDGAALLLRAIRGDPSFGMAHQNIAARYDRATYRPTEIDTSGNREIALYDAYNLVGQRFMHVGRSREAVASYARALWLQRKLAANFVLPAQITASLRRLPRFEPELPVRILPYEWVTQIGHLGMLDTYKKIQLLGWMPKANSIILAPRDKVVNRTYLSCWAQYFIVVEDQRLIDSLFPYQRFVGDTFNGFLDDRGEGVDWCDIGARAHIAWDAAGRGPLLQLPFEIERRGQETLEEVFGIPGNAWFVALHSRGGGYYREGGLHSQVHRNAPISTCFPAIRQITERGGWVIRMGDASMEKLPRLERVVDYAHSKHRNDWLDVYCWARARIFLGTTSGPTNAVISFGTPCALVNCLSNYSQLWNSRVVFSLKAFWSQRENRYLRISEFTAPPIRGKIFNMSVLGEEGITPRDNSSTDISLVVSDMFELLHKKRGLPDTPDTRAFWRQVHDKSMWGSARPSPRFFEHNRDIFLGATEPWQEEWAERASVPGESGQ